MMITMTTKAQQSASEIKEFLENADCLKFESVSKDGRNDWIEELLIRHVYKKCGRADKGVLKRYIIKMTGLSLAQTTRLISEYLKRGTLKKDKSVESKRNCFEKIYTRQDIALLAKVDNAHQCLSGPATVKILASEHEVFGKNEYANLKNVSVSHLYRLRGSSPYREKVKIFSKTRPTKAPIGERRKPEPNGQPGYLCVDTVHQGDKLGEKGVYHINIVDMATQYEFIGAVEAISEMYMEKMLIELLEKFPFAIIEFHSDNGSEFINRVIAKLLNKLLIKQTKSRPRNSNDNGLAEAKNGAVVRKHLGYTHIPKGKANIINDFYQNIFNDYLNYHRPCAFARIKTDKKGKEIRNYPKEDYLRPKKKLKALPSAGKYRKPEKTFAKLDKIAYAMSDTDYAEFMQKEKSKMLKNSLTDI